MNTLTVLLVVSFASSSIAHPAFQHQFNNIVNSNPCLKKCMDQATETDTELSLLKTANISGFLLNIDNICQIITTARECVAGCNVDSNPFELESMTTICSRESLEEVRSVSECLDAEGESVLSKCNEECGDYEKINGEVHRLTQAFRPELNNKEDMSRVMAKIGDACQSLKCSDRCTVKELSQRCAGEVDVAATIQSLIQRILVAQRRDLERMRLVETMAASTPVQCSYMYIPEVMFDASKDQAAHEVIANEMSLVKGMERRTQPKQENDQKSEMNLALSQLQSHLLRKQMQLLEMQEKNLMRESAKLDMELQLLARKRARLSKPIFKQW